MQVSDFTEDKSGELVRDLAGDWSFVPAPLPGRMKWTQELAVTLSSADRAIGQLAGIGSHHVRTRTVRLSSDGDRRIGRG